MKNKRKNWSYKEDMNIINLYNKGRSVKFIAEVHKVKTAAIYTRLSTLRTFGYITDPISNRRSLDRETIAEMKDAVERFPKIADIPNEWKFDWAEINDKNLTQIGIEISKLYEKLRGE